MPGRTAGPAPARRSRPSRPAHSTSATECPARGPALATPVSAKLAANLIERAVVDRVMTVDLHAGQIQGFFDIPTDNLFAAPVMVRDIQERYGVANLVV